MFKDKAYFFRVGFFCLLKKTHYLARERGINKRECISSFSYQYQTSPFKPFIALLLFS